MWLRVMKFSQIQYNDKFSLLKLIKALLAFYDVIKTTVQNSVGNTYE